ncbi:heparan-sulfate 6-O-sulfotransferase 3 isoform X3 [Prinia subflava]|uniref:heparan-sulfate 6-O-sulfotransferase 3 isoform X3 n=1 Tax=Prinia subflava TaxID=208062 RepID=UPI002FDFBFE0
MRNLTEPRSPGCASGPSHWLLDAPPPLSHWLLPPPPAPRAAGPGPVPEGARGAAPHAPAGRPRAPIGGRAGVLGPPIGWLGGRPGRDWPAGGGGACPAGSRALCLGWSCGGAGSGAELCGRGTALGARPRAASSGWPPRAGCGAARWAERSEPRPPACQDHAVGEGAGRPSAAGSERGGRPGSGRQRLIPRRAAPAHRHGRALQQVAAAAAAGAALLAHRLPVRVARLPRRRLPPPPAGVRRPPRGGPGGAGGRGGGGGDAAAGGQVPLRPGGAVPAGAVRHAGPRRDRLPPHPEDGRHHLRAAPGAQHPPGAALLLPGRAEEVRLPPPGRRQGHLALLPLLHRLELRAARRLDRAHQLRARRHGAPRLRRQPHPQVA